MQEGLQNEKRETDKHKSWGMPTEKFKGHVATDGPLLGTAGKWGACGWSVVQLGYEETGPLHGMYGSTEAELGGPAHHQEGGVYGFPLPSQKK